MVLKKGSTINLNFGARPVKRKIEVMIENKVASLLIERKAGEGTHVSIDVDQDEISVSFVDKKTSAPEQRVIESE
ncbi:MAG: hypothetical protein HRU09_12160 [Oligoflexales bacterium]|nr:hypothetical protein [Oligoflexales bacterium]